MLLLDYIFKVGGATWREAVKNFKRNSKNSKSDFCFKFFFNGQRDITQKFPTKVQPFSQSHLTSSHMKSFFKNLQVNSSNH